MLNFFAPYKTLQTIINTLNENTTESMTYFAKTDYFGDQCFENSKICTKFLTKAKKADEREKQMRPSRFKLALFNDLLQKFGGIRVLFRSAETCSEWKISDNFGIASFRLFAFLFKVISSKYFDL